MSQQLLFPLSLSFTKKEVKALDGVKEQLEHTGFVFSNWKEEEVEVSGMREGGWVG